MKPFLCNSVRVSAIFCSSPLSFFAAIPTDHPWLDSAMTERPFRSQLTRFHNNENVDCKMPVWMIIRQGYCRMWEYLTIWRCLSYTPRHTHADFIHQSISFHCSMRHSHCYKIVLWSLGWCKASFRIPSHLTNHHCSVPDDWRYRKGHPHSPFNFSINLLQLSLLCKLFYAFSFSAERKVPSLSRCSHYDHC